MGTLLVLLSFEAPHLYRLRPMLTYSLVVYLHMHLYINKLLKRLLILTIKPFLLQNKHDALNMYTPTYSHLAITVLRLFR